MSGTILFSKESLAAYNKSYEIDVGGNLNNPLAISEDGGVPFSATDLLYNVLTL